MMHEIAANIQANAPLLLLLAVLVAVLLVYGALVAEGDER